jgi:hypothetical protein
MGPKTETSPGKGTQDKMANPANVEAVVVQQGGGGGPSGTPIVGGTPKGVLGNQHELVLRHNFLILSHQTLGLIWKDWKRSIWKSQMKLLTTTPTK